MCTIFQVIPVVPNARYGDFNRRNKKRPFHAAHSVRAAGVVHSLDQDRHEFTVVGRRFCNAARHIPPIQSPYLAFWTTYRSKFGTDIFTYC